MVTATDAVAESVYALPSACSFRLAGSFVDHSASNLSLLFSTSAYLVAAEIRGGRRLPAPPTGIGLTRLFVSGIFQATLELGNDIDEGDPAHLTPVANLDHVEFP